MQQHIRRMYVNDKRVLKGLIRSLLATMFGSEAGRSWSALVLSEMVSIWFAFPPFRRFTHSHPPQYCWSPLTRNLKNLHLQCFVFIRYYNSCWGGGQWNQSFLERQLIDQDQSHYHLQVRGDVPANVVMAGVPARIIKHLNSNHNKSDHESNSDLKPGHPKSSTSNANQSNHSKSITARSPGGGSKNLNPTSAATDDDQASGHSEETSDPFAECFLANIPSALSNGDLHNALSVFGEVRSLTMDRSRRLGFVRFGSAQAAEEAVEAGRGPDGLVVMMNQETNEKMVVGIERRRMSDTNRTFNPDLITSTRCLIRRLPNTVDFDELKRTIEEHAGSLVEWTVQDFTSPDPTKPSVDKFISLEFEQLCGAREAVRLSQNVNGTLGGIDVPGTDGIKARIEARKQFSPQSAYRTSYRGHQQQPFHHNSEGGYHQTYPNHHQQHHPRSSRGSYGGYHSRGGSPNHHHHHYPNTTPNPAPGAGGGLGNYQNNKAFNGSFTKYKPRRSVPGGMNGSE